MSIRLRLALWYGGLTGVVLLLVILATYAVHSRTHYDDLDRLLVGGAEHLASMYATSATADIGSMLETPLAPDLVVSLYDAHGRPTAASANADRAPRVDPQALLAAPPRVPFDPLVALAPPLVGEESNDGAFGLANDTDGRPWRVYVLPVNDGAGYVVTASPLDRVESSVQRLRYLAAFLGVVGVGVAFIAGWLLASRVLRPVAVLTETAGAIARSHDLKRRVPVHTPRDELGRLAETFNEMLASLEQAYRAQQRFVSDASHELRAPLTAIHANLELLQRQPTMSPDARQEAILEASREAHRLTRLVADLLALARADAGVPLRRRRLELDRVLLDVLGDTRHLLRGQRIEVTGLEPVQVDGDPDRLKQLLLILVDNAAKYTPSDGQILLALNRKGTAAEVIVRDTGVGISPEDLPHIFERFYRADPARSRDPGGTGLGLSIAQWIAKQHDGEVTLTSELGHGTTAIVRLPMLH